MYDLKSAMRRMGVTSRSKSTDTLKRLAEGAVAGLVGTWVLQALRKASQKVAPATVPAEGDAGHYIVNQAERVLPEEARHRIPESAENATATALGLGYGMTFGALYGLLRPRGGSILLDGAALGLGCWAAGYLGWLPATGLIDPIWRQKPAEAVGPAARHALFGVATVAAYETIRGYA